MARSYKKHPYCGARKDRFYKNYANRRLRRLPVEEEIPSGKEYKRYNYSWKICDYWSYHPGPFLYLRWRTEEEDEENAFWRWYKNCRMK